MKLNLADYERMVPTCTLEKDGYSIKFHTPTEHVKALVDTIFVQEPETIDWISTFVSGNIFLDIGANIGLYSIWATISQDVQCFAFEPESLNFSILMRNIVSNKLGHKLIAYPIAISNKSGFDEFHLTVFEPGESCHVFGEKINYTKQPIEPAISQGCYSTTIDNLVSESVIPIPNYIKVDVDGIEPKIIEGAKKTLESSALDSILIEVNDDIIDDWEMIYYIESQGFKATIAPPSILAPTPTVHNVILRRK